MADHEMRRQRRDTEWLDDRHLARTIGVSTASIKRWRAKDPSFPKSTWVSARTRRTARVAFDEWMASRPHAARSPEWEPAPEPARKRLRPPLRAVR
jgi:predicted DNA-binding transcriptional regulator AlpA